MGLNLLAFKFLLTNQQSLSLSIITTASALHEYFNEHMNTLINEYTFIVNPDPVGFVINELRSCSFYPLNIVEHLRLYLALNQRNCISMAEIEVASFGLTQNTHYPNIYPTDPNLTAWNMPRS